MWWWLNPWKEIRRLRRDVEIWKEDSAYWSTQWDLDSRRLGALQEENLGLRWRIAEMEEQASATEVLCGCQTCTDARPGLRGWDQPGFRYACEKCGNKRCPHHHWHDFKCTGSNEPDQIGEPI